MLVYQNNRTATLLVYPTNPLGIELYYHANVFHCFGGKTRLLITWMKTLYREDICLQTMLCQPQEQKGLCFDSQWGSGACFSKVPITFRARKASRQTAICLAWKANPLTCFWCKKNKEDCEVWWLRTPPLRRYKGNCGTRNRPEKFRNFWETGHWLAH